MRILEPWDLEIWKISKSCSSRAFRHYSTMSLILQMAPKSAHQSTIKLRIKGHTVFMISLPYLFSLGFYILYIHSSIHTPPSYHTVTQPATHLSSYTATSLSTHTSRGFISHPSMHSLVEPASHPYIYPPIHPSIRSSILPVILVQSCLDNELKSRGNFLIIS